MSGFHVIENSLELCKSVPEFDAALRHDGGDDIAGRVLKF
jgi:hypothetical protein